MVAEWRKVGMSPIRNVLYGRKQRTEDAFKIIVDGLIDRNSVVLNAGCGFYEGLHLRGRCKKVIGVDLDIRLYGNEDIDDPILGDLAGVRLPDSSVDLIVCRWVVEHLQKPGNTFQNFYRMLKPGGTLLLLTSNRWHYINVAARMTPHWLNAKICEWIGEVGEAYPVHYYCNTAGALKKALYSIGYKGYLGWMVEPEPDYWKFSTPSFLVGVALERTLSVLPLEGLRRDIIVICRKPVHD